MGNGSKTSIHKLFVCIGVYIGLYAAYKLIGAMIGPSIYIEQRFSTFFDSRSDTDHLGNLDSVRGPLSTSPPLKIVPLAHCVWPI